MPVRMYIAGGIDQEIVEPAFLVKFWKVLTSIDRALLANVDSLVLSCLRVILQHIGRLVPQVPDGAYF